MTNDSTKNTVSVTLCAGVGGGAGILGIVIGFVAATLLLVFFPRIHRKLVTCCTSKHWRSQLEDQHVTERTHNDSYSQIDDMKTRTFVNKFSIKKKKENGIPKQYEEYAVDVNPRRYSDLENQSGNVKAYEDCESKEPDAKTTNIVTTEKRLSNHTYFILEPGSDKRVPVKPLDKQILQNDPYHMYFILEPGTNKVTPVTHAKALAMHAQDPNYEPVYFVLEPIAVNTTSSSEAEPYAVNDLTTDHTYFILEKQ